MSLLALPLDILSCLILPLLPPPSLVAFALVCRRSHDLVYSPEDSTHLWHLVYLQAFGPLPPSSTITTLSNPFVEDTGTPGYWRRTVEARWRVLTALESFGGGFYILREETMKPLEYWGSQEVVETLISIIRTATPQCSNKQSSGGLDSFFNLATLTAIFSEDNFALVLAFIWHSGKITLLEKPTTQPVISSSAFVSPRTLRHQSRQWLASGDAHTPPSIAPSPARPGASSEPSLEELTSSRAHLLCLLPPISGVPMDYLSLDRGTIYNIRSHTTATAWGPFLPSDADGPSHLIPVTQTRGRKVDWILLCSIYHAVAANIEQWEAARLDHNEAHVSFTGEDSEEEEEEEGEGDDVAGHIAPIQPPNQFQDVRRMTVVEGVDGSKEKMKGEDLGNDAHEDTTAAFLVRERDWAGVEGRWHRVLSFVDYSDILAFNFSGGDETSELALTFERAPFWRGYEEAIRILLLDLKVTGYEPAEADNGDSTRPPRIKFSGQMIDATGEGGPIPLETMAAQGGSTVLGFVDLMDSGEVRWSFKSYLDGAPLWSSEAIQPGGPRSRRGMLGLWSGWKHEEQDPVGPFWMWKEEVSQDSNET